MFGSFGFPAVAVSATVVTTGVWNLGFKFGLPIVAVVLLAVTGQSTGRAVGAALIGVLLIVVSGTVLWLVFRDEASARRIGRLGDRMPNCREGLLQSPASLIARFPAGRLCLGRLQQPFPADPVDCFFMAGFPVLVKQGDFLCCRSQSSGGDDDVVAHLLGAVGPALQSLGPPHRGLGLAAAGPDLHRPVGRGRPRQPGVGQGTVAHRR
jgi:hypothetical protein